MAYTAAGSGQGRRKNIIDAYIDRHVLPEEENGYICMRRTVVYYLK